MNYIGKGILFTLRRKRSNVNNMFIAALIALRRKPEIMYGRDKVLHSRICD